MSAIYNFKYDSAKKSGDFSPRTSRFSSIALHFGYVLKEVPMGYVYLLELMFPLSVTILSSPIPGMIPQFHRGKLSPHNM